MNLQDLLEHCLAEPGAWQDEPWEGDVVAKVAGRPAAEAETASLTGTPAPARALEPG
ncbi:MAG: hypothetical protein ACR2JN_02825 [Lapillicoccus sp.]